MSLVVTRPTFLLDHRVIVVFMFCSFTFNKELINSGIVLHVCILFFICPMKSFESYMRMIIHVCNKKAVGETVTSGICKLEDLLLHV